MKQFKNHPKFVAAMLTAGVTGMVILNGCGGPELAGDGRSLGTVPVSRTADQPSGRQSMTQVPSESWQALGEPIKDTRSDAPEGIVTKKLDMKVYFAFDRSTIGASERHKLEALADYLQNYDEYRLIIEAHADKRGSDEYNRALSERRALAVKEYLTNLGVDADRLETVAYGEEKPAVKNASTAREYAKNRRAEFVVEIERVSGNYSSSSE